MALNFGCLAAEGDPDLLKYFHKTQQAADIANFSRPRSQCIYIGRQGFGKTAMTTWLTSQDSAHTTVLLVCPDTHRITLEGDEPTKTDIRFIAKLELMSEVGKLLVKKARLTGTLYQDAKRLCCDGWQESVGKTLKRFKGVTVFGIGLEMDSAERANYLRSLQRNNRAGELQQLMHRIAQAHNVMVVVDSPEEVIGQGTDTFTPENAGRTGAILAALADVSKSGVRVVCYLREQIYQWVLQEYDNSQHFEDQIDRLHWSADDLIQLVDKRVKWLLGPKAEWSDVFDNAQAEMIGQVFPILSNGPRDLVSLLNAAGRDRDKLAIDDILDCRYALRAERITNLNSQHKQWSNADQVATEVLTALFDLYDHGHFARGEAQAIFRDLYTSSSSRLYSLQHQSDWVNHVAAGQPTIEEVLFSLGMLGFVDRHGDKQFPWSNRSVMEFNTSDQYFVSDLFRIS